VLQPDAALVGDLAGLGRVALMAQEDNFVFTRTTGRAAWSSSQKRAFGLSDAPFLEFPRDPPEWHVDRCEYMTAQPLRVGADGHIVLSDSPGMEYDPATDRLASTRMIELARLPREARWTANGCR
jgi:hypothetical protein